MSVKWNLLYDLFEDRKFFSVVWSFVKLRQYMYFLGVNFVLLTVLCIVWIVIYIFSYFVKIMNLIICLLMFIRIQVLETILRLMC